jgi:putative phosphoribosyl transferase
MACRRLPGPSLVRVVPGAGHLFEEPGALDQVTELAIGWFQQYLGPPVTTV